jgi:hypothetical protein
MLRTLHPMEPSMRATLAASLLLLGAVGTAAAAEVSRETVIDASPAKVWRTISPFCSIGDWHPVIAKCDEEKVKGATRRRLTTKDGGVIVERLLSQDNKRRRYSYSIIESPLPVSNYHSTLSVADDHGKAKVVWQGNFDPKGASEEEATKVIAGIYEAGLNGIRDKVKP